MLTKTELKLISELLKAASDSFSNHGCNDFELANIPENIRLLKDIDSEYQPTKGSSLLTQDWLLMNHLSQRTQDEANRL